MLPQSRAALRTALYTRPLGTACASPVAGPSRLPLPQVRSGQRQQARTLLTRRGTSFWATSFPNNPGNTAAPSSSEQLPPLPIMSPVTEPAKTVAPRIRHRKERYLDSLMDKAGEMGLQCSILDSKGNWTAEEGTYRKMDLCRAHDLDPRDLRKLDSLTPSLVPVILSRRSCILVSMLHLRALIKPDRVIIFNAPGHEDSEAAKRFKAHLQANVRSGLALNAEERESGYSQNAEEREEVECEDYGLPYEHRALESILVDTSNALEEEMGFIRRLVENLLEDFEHDIDRENLRRLLHYSKRLAGFQSRAKYIKSTVDELLDSDEDLSGMYITDKMLGKPRALYDHEQLELLLESFTKQVEEIVSEIDTTVINMQSTQEVAELMLDSGRNALLALDIKVSIATLGIGTGALVAGIFGMNLTSTLEETPYAFAVVSGAAALAGLLAFLYGSKVLRKVRHISLVSKPSSLPQSVREAKEKFVRERAEVVRRLEAEAAEECSALAAQATADAKSVPASNGIPDYEARWDRVRKGLKSRASLWDRILRPNSLRSSLLGMGAPSKTPAWRVDSKAMAAKPSASPSHPLPPSPMSSPSRPTTPRVDSPSLSRAISSTPMKPTIAGVPPPADVPVAVTPPSLDAVKKEGYYDDDVALLPENESALLLTSAAVAQLAKIGKGEPADSDLVLRVGVESGGCHGYQYKMELANDRGVDDYLLEPEGALPVVVDLASASLLKGATLDYATELIGSSFRIAHNPQARDGGNCGCGVSWELEGQPGEHGLK